MEQFLEHLFNGLNLGAVYALIALGYSLVFGVLQFINFAHSEVYMMGAFGAYFIEKSLRLEQSPGLPSFFILILLTMAACAILGLVIERLAYRPLRNAPKLNVLISAIGVSLLLQNLAQVIFGVDPKVFPEAIQDFEFLVLGPIHLRFLDMVLLATALVAMTVMHFVINHTRLGLMIRAVSFNARSAGLVGIPVNRVIVSCFVIGSALAGLAAVLVGLKYPKVDPYMGTLFGLKAFVAAVLGGIGNLPGAVLGGLLMGISEQFVVGYISSTYRDAFAFGLLIVILLFKPNGLLGEKTLEKV